MAALDLNVHLTPLRQGDLDGLCGVYSVLNALQWLVPAARNQDRLTELFDHTLGRIYKIENIRDGGEEPQLADVFEFVRRHAKKHFEVDIEMTALVDSRKEFDRPDKALQANFESNSRGVGIFGFEGLDSHWTVARGVTNDEVILFDSWEYRSFDRRKFAWGAPAKGAKKTQKIYVTPKELNWVVVR